MTRVTVPVVSVFLNHFLAEFYQAYLCKPRQVLAPLEDVKGHHEKTGLMQVFHYPWGLHTPGGTTTYDTLYYVTVH